MSPLRRLEPRFQLFELHARGVHIDTGQCYILLFFVILIQILFLDTFEFRTRQNTQ